MGEMRLCELVMASVCPRFCGSDRGGPQRKTVPTSYSCNPANRDPNRASRLVFFAPVADSHASAKPKILYIDRMPNQRIGSGSHCPEKWSFHGSPVKGVDAPAARSSRVFAAR